MEEEEIDVKCISTWAARRVAAEIERASACLQQSLWETSPEERNKWIERARPAWWLRVLFRLLRFLHG